MVRFAPPWPASSRRPASPLARRSTSTYERRSTLSMTATANDTSSTGGGGISPIAALRGAFFGRLPPLSTSRARSATVGSRRTGVRRSQHRTRAESWRSLASLTTNGLRDRKIIVDADARHRQHLGEEPQLQTRRVAVITLSGGEADPLRRRAGRLARRIRLPHAAQRTRRCARRRRHSPSPRWRRARARASATPFPLRQVRREAFTHRYLTLIGVARRVGKRVRRAGRLA